MIGFIGLGIMGRPMAKNLLKAGYDLAVFDIIESAVCEVVSCGAVKSSIKEIAEKSDIIITMLPDSPQVKEVVLGKGGIIQYAKEGTLIVDMSSIAPSASKEMYNALKTRGIKMLDAPVSGGEPKAIDGTLAIMAGGDETDFHRAKPLFDILGSSVLLVGDIGSGNTCKLTNQVIVALNIAALSEGLMLAKKAGTDPVRVFEAIRGGLAGSVVMDAKSPMILKGNFRPGFKIDLHIKDLKNAINTGDDCNSPMPLTKEIFSAMKELSAQGEGSSDHSAVAKYYEALAGVSLSDE